MDRHDQESQQGRRRFRIWVAGRLDDRFTDGIDCIEPKDDAAGGTRLTGDLVDRSHIHGILDRLRQLGIEVLRFETYPATEEGPPP